MQQTGNKVIIIGAGLSGMTAGIYLLDNGFDVEIYEKHTIPGGECTGWRRQGSYIDGCAHWIVGVNPEMPLFRLWKHTGAFDENTPKFQTEEILCCDIRGKQFHFYANLEKLQQEMLFFFPEDKKQIRKFIRGVKAYQHVQIPTKKPLDQFHLFNWIAFGIKMLPMAIPFLRYKHTSVERYVQRFKNPDFRKIFTRFLAPDYNIHSFFYIMQALSQDDSGVIEGGSLPMMLRIAENFKKKGGVLHLGTPVKRILLENRTAVGIELENGTKVSSDFVVPALDAHHVLHQLLEGQIKDSYFEKRFADPITYPKHSSFALSFRTKKDVSDYPKMLDFELDDLPIAKETYDHYSIRNFSFDPSLKHDGKTLLTVLLTTHEPTYEYLKELPREEYEKFKEETLETFRKLIAKDYGLELEDIESLDMTTPLTYERYCNAYYGSYMSFITTEKGEGLMRPGLFEKTKNLVLAGQWIMPPGGLPIALFSGKHAAIRVTKMAHKKFVNKEAINRK